MGIEQLDHVDLDSMSYDLSQNPPLLFFSKKDYSSPIQSSSLAGCGLKFSECITVPLMGKSLFPKSGWGKQNFFTATILFHPLFYPVVNSRNLYYHLSSQMNRHSCLMCSLEGSISNWLCDVVPAFPFWTLPTVSCCIRQSSKWRQIRIREGSSSPSQAFFHLLAKGTRSRIK